MEQAGGIFGGSPGGVGGFHPRGQCRQRGEPLLRELLADLLLLMRREDIDHHMEGQ